MKWILPLICVLSACTLPAQRSISRQDAVKNHLRSVKQTENINGENRIIRFIHYDEKGRIVSDLKSEYTDSTTKIVHDTTIFYSDTSWTRINLLNQSDSTHSSSRREGTKRMTISETYSKGYVRERFILISDSLYSISIQERLGNIFSASIMRTTSKYDGQGRLIERTFLDSLHYDKSKYEMSHEYYTITYGTPFVEQTYFNVVNNVATKDYKIFFAVDSMMDSVVRYDKNGKVRSTESYHRYQDKSDSLIVSRNKRGDTMQVTHIYRNPMSRDMPYSVAVFRDGLSPASLESHFTYAGPTVRAQFFYLEKSGLVYEQIETEGPEQEEIRRIHFDYTYYE